MAKKAKEELNTEEVIAEEATEEVAAESTGEEPTVIFYNGQAVVELLEDVTSDSRLCRLADGSTTHVPLSILGE